MPSLNIKNYLLAAAGIAFVLLLAWALRIDYLRGHHKATAAAEKAAHAQTVTNYREAAKLAQEAAEARKQATEAEHKRIADNADENYDSLRAQYRALLVRFSAKTDFRSADGTGLPERASPAGVPEVGASSAGFYISGTDGLRTADLGAYATACFKWAEDVATSSTPRTEGP